MPTLVDIPNIGPIAADTGFSPRPVCSDGVHRVGQDGVVSITATGDGKVEFIARANHTLAYVKSSLGYPAYYPVHPVQLTKPVQAVLMDLDGTSVHSEHFWIWMIELTIGSLRRAPRFTFVTEDLPYVSGHSVSEHLQYALDKYCPATTLEQARPIYFEHTRRELAEILAGRGQPNAFTPAPGLRDFLLTLKDRGVKLALVTSGLHEKAWPEIVSAFRALDLGDPARFYDAIITAGFQPGRGRAGTLGELSPKPHPWLYAEAARVGLGLPFEQRNRIVGLEDSGAGVCALRIAGFPTIGLAGGNIIDSGTQRLCCAYCQTLADVLKVIL